MLKVVICDIEPIQRKSLKILLHEKYRRQVSVQDTENGQEALNIVLNNSIDLVIIDHRVIGIDGLSFVQKVRKQKPFQKIIIYTMAIDPTVKEAYRAHGVNQILIKPIRPKLLLNNFSSLLVHTSNNPKGKVISKVEEIIKFIDEHLNEDLTLTYIAKRMNLSPFYVSKIFKKELGINFVKYVTERKMEKAKELLKNSEIPIVNIAFEMGYREPSYFTKVFKRSENMTPSQYRHQQTRLT